MTSILQIASLWIAVACGLIACAPAESVPEPSAVQFETEDGFTLYADFVPSGEVDAPVAILLHMYRSDRGAWAPLVPALRDAGFAVLAVDQRAHGESIRKGTETLNVAELSRSRFADLVREGPLDVRAARSFLLERGLSAERLALVGASYGCTVALLSANRIQGVKALALLSPGNAYFGIDVRAAVRDFSGALLAVAAEDDPRSAESACTLARIHGGTNDLVVLTSGGHGTQLFESRPEIVQRVAEFLRQAVHQGSPEVAWRRSLKTEFKTPSSPEPFAGQPNRHSNPEIP